MVFLTFAQLLKFIIGFVHVGANQNMVRISVIFSSQSLFLVVIVLLRKAFRLKICWVLLLVQYIFRAIIHFFLLLRVFSINIDFPFSLAANKQLDDIQITYTYYVFGLAVLQIFSSLLENEQRTQKINNYREIKRKNQCQLKIGTKNKGRDAIKTCIPLNHPKNR